MQRRLAVVASLYCYLFLVVRLRIIINQVINLLHEVENRFSEEDQQLVKKLFAEANVLSAIYHYFELQSIG